MNIRDFLLICVALLISLTVPYVVPMFAAIRRVDPTEGVYRGYKLFVRNAVAGLCITSQSASYQFPNTDNISPPLLMLPVKLDSCISRVEALPFDKYLAGLLDDKWILINDSKFNRFMLKSGIDDAQCLGVLPKTSATGDVGSCGTEGPGVTDIVVEAKCIPSLKPSQTFLKKAGVVTDDGMVFYQICKQTDQNLCLTGIGENVCTMPCDPKDSRQLWLFDVQELMKKAINLTLPTIHDDENNVNVKKDGESNNIIITGNNEDEVN